jgi:predicted alpha/beta-hydrolase family hydrolase
VLPLFLGGNVEKERPKHLMASPLYWVTPLAPPTLCVHGTKDNYAVDSLGCVSYLLAAFRICWLRRQP